MLCLDVETSTFQKGNPFSASRQLVCVAWYDGKEGGVFYTDTPDWKNKLRTIYNKHTTICGHNFKFDMHWLRHYGFDFKDKTIWDTMVAEYTMNNQQPFVSLNDVALKYLNAKKEDAVKEFWDAGIDTQDIPRNILTSYAILDTTLTHRVAQKQRGIIGAYNPLFQLQMADLKVLQEMEWNGMKIDVEGSKRRSKRLSQHRDRVVAILNADVPEGFNWASDEHISALLYGGVCKIKKKVPNGEWKSGVRKGTIKYKNVEEQHVLKRLVTPLKGTKLKKEGYYSTGDDVLTKLGDHKYIKGIKLMRRIDKLCSTYLDKIPEIIHTKEWMNNLLHGTFNQVVTQTGRLSSKEPNLQNNPPQMGLYFVSRY